MTTRRWFMTVACAAMIGSGVLAVAADKPTTQPHDKGKMGHGPQLPKEFRDLTDLSDDQKTQIIAIQQKFDDEMAKLRKQTTADQMAVLTDAQRAEMAANAEKARLGKKAETAEDKAKKAREDADKAAATQPAK